MNFEIRLIKENEIEDAAKVYAAAFNNADIDENWNQKTANAFIRHWFERKKDLFFIIIVNNKVAGGVVGDIVTYSEGKYLDEVVLFVDPKNQKDGIGKALLNKIISEAINKYQIEYLSWLANKKNEFPISWYENIGLKKTHWILMDGEAKKILKNLNK